MKMRERAAERAAQAKAAEAERKACAEQAFLSEENQALIRALRGSERYGRFVSRLPDRAIGMSASHIERALDAAFEECQDNPEMAARFEAVLVDGNPEALRENGRRQAERLRAAWQRAKESDARVGERFASFREFVDGLAPIHGDRPGLGYAEFVSPRQSGNVASFGPQDVVVQADRYVYGSFDGIAHAMAGQPERAYRLDEADLQDRAEIVMQDVANILPRVGDRFVGRYLDNLFDYKNGKEILARYLSMVFTSADEARVFFRQNNSTRQAQLWDKGTLVPCSVPDISFQDSDTAESVRERYAAAELALQRRADEIETRMKDILAETGIEPPLSLEIRIPDRVKII